MSKVLVRSGSAPTPWRIMPLGDSITVGATTGDPSSNFCQGYRSNLYKRLATLNYSVQFVGGSPFPWGFDPTPTPINTSDNPDLRLVDQDGHRGYSAWGCADLMNGRDGYAGMPSWLGTDAPDLVLLMCGINDLRYAVPGDLPACLAAAEAGLAALVNYVIDNSESKIIVAQITPYNDVAPYNDANPNVLNYNAWIADTLVPYYSGTGRVSTVNQHENFLTSLGDIDATLYSNGINHPNTTGYNKMAVTWLAGIRAALPTRAK